MPNILKENFRALLLWLCTGLLFLITSRAHSQENSSEEASGSKTSARTSNKGSGKVGKGRKFIQQKTCLLSIKTQGLQEGDLAEVVDQSNTRIAVIRLERMSQSSGVLAARVLVGEERCKTLAGYKVVPLSTQINSGLNYSTSRKESLVYIAPQAVFTQTNLPGFALNKFLSPSFSQRGFGVHLASIFPSKPFRISRLPIQGQFNFSWNSVLTSPSLDLVKNSEVIGVQKISTNSMKVRTGLRLLTFNELLWTGVGGVIFENFTQKSTLAPSPSGSSDQLFQALRDSSGLGFGAYAEQGFIINGSGRISVLAGLGFAHSVKTPIVEDAEASNLSDKFTISGPPFFVGVNIMVPLMEWAFAEANFDYKTMSMSLPLVNQQVTKAKYETTSFSVGAGVKF